MIRGNVGAPDLMLWRQRAKAVTAGLVSGLGGRRAGPAENPSKPLPRPEAGTRHGELSQSKKKLAAGDLPRNVNCFSFEMHNQGN